MKIIEQPRCEDVGPTQSHAGAAQELAAQCGSAGAVGDTAKVAAKKAEAREVAVATKNGVRGRSCPVHTAGVAVVVVYYRSIPEEIIKVGGIRVAANVGRWEQCDQPGHSRVDATGRNLVVGKGVAGSRVVDNLVRG